jgi:hypothetical protein
MVRGPQLVQNDIKHENVSSGARPKLKILNRVVRFEAWATWATCLFHLSQNHRANIVSD